ncbi:MAG: molybdopterin-dependent oxidoreductase [Thermomicrobiales bacterium]
MPDPSNASTSTSAPAAPPHLRASFQLDGEQRDRLRGMIAGALAAIAMLVSIVIVRSLTGIISFLDVLADALLLALPIGLFSYLLGLFGTQAKTLLLVGLIVLLILIGALLGLMYARQSEGSRRVQWARAITYGISLFAGMSVFTLLFVNSREPNLVAGGGVWRVIGSLAVVAAVFALVLGTVLHLLRRLDPAPVVSWPTSEQGGPASVQTGALDRRRLVTRLGLGIASLAGVLVLGREVARVANRKTVAGGPSGEMPPVFTPNDDFYVVSKNFVDPDPHRGDEWSIKIDGLVTNPLTLTRSDLEALQVHDFVSTLTCISNPIAGPLIGTARWTGVPLATVLRKAGIGAGAFKLICEGEDGYSDSIPIERALMPEPHIVWAMNGEPLPRLHGTPVRLIVPGLYGIKNVKWLTKLTVTRDDYQGYWQQRDWTDAAIIKTSSRIDMPGDRSLIAPGPTEIGGIAFAGDRGISAVEVSTDDGKTWHQASIVENPSPGGLSWVLWKLPWSPQPGAYQLVVRATDGMGEVQTEKGAPELPDGASGWHRITVGVA